MRPRSRSRLALSVFAMLACAGIALVTVIDPYAGATAAPYYQQPVLVKSTGVQRYAVQGGYVLVDIERDGYTTVISAPEPTEAATASGSSAGSSAGGSSGASLGKAVPAGTAQTYAAQLVAARGWAPSEFSCLVSLWNRESGWNMHAANPSGAYGIPQALPGSKMGAGWQDDYQVQIRWGLGYIAGSYGSPCGAWAHSNGFGWY